ncbi:hypothetical protein YH65_03910 [Sulfurovum lithotrophicum]|uniref:Lipoprotein n=1 Tax=Sulfurovum lithotrophicum TaxID=206403 RepID=A0A7U4M0M6_9BACT|nr:hypothetical protein [Sulfurovum lithotrophicum]AKF24627.1 hypothetical protein YH65_03910 [Sulfurovum lithotrophicum]
MQTFETKAFQKKNMPTLLILSAAILLLTGCSDKEKNKSLTEGGMKCGAGKCGSSMVDGSAVLVKKKMNILDQIKKEDKRRDCVLKAKTTKALYNCVRDPETGRLTIRENNKTESFENKITLEKKEKKVPIKVSNGSMKCEAGKCSSGN